MKVKMCRPVNFGYLIFFISGYIISLVAGNDCKSVKDEFRKISYEDLVPELPIIDEGLQVCSRSLTAQQASCCSRDTEMKYLLAAEQYIVQNVRDKNEDLKSLITEHTRDYQGKVLALARHTQNSTSSKLLDWYSIPETEHRLSVSKLFTDIEEFLNQKNVIIKNSVSTFFDNLFPVIFKNVIYKSSVNVWTHHYHHCLAKHRQEIHPKVFGNHPEDIAKTLSNGLGLARAYLEAMRIVTETLNTTDNILIEDECKHAVVRLQYCKHCHGFVDVKPCKGFCLNVMQGCLSKISEIGPEWNDIITSVEGLVREMSEKSLDEVFKELVVGVSDAIMVAMVEASKFYQNVHELCGIPVDANITTAIPRPPTVPHTSAVLPEVSGPLSMDIMQVTLDLVDSKGLFNNLGETICSQPEVFEQDPMSGTCWNGTDVSVYVSDTVDSNILEQARNNPEVKVTLVLDPDLRNLKDKMASVNLVLQSHVRKTDHKRPRSYMISDDHSIYGSGDSHIGNVNIGDGKTLADDEDYTLTSGSGSGVEEDVDTTIETGNVDSRIDVVFPDNPSNRNPYDVDQSGRLGLDPPRNREPPARQNPGSDPKGSAAGVVSSVTLTLTTLVSFVLIYR